jgi:hypothetical protein
MSNPIWKQDTRYLFPDPRKPTFDLDCRIYQYRFASEWYHWATRCKYEIHVPFNTIETNTNGDSQGHRRVLEDPDFSVRDTNIMEWVKSCFTTGKADYTFYISRMTSDQWISHLELVARFSDRRQAIIFKMMFG